MGVLSTDQKLGMVVFWVNKNCFLPAIAIHTSESILFSVAIVVPTLTMYCVPTLWVFCGLMRPIADFGDVHRTRRPHLVVLDICTFTPYTMLDYKASLPMLFTHIRII